MATLTKKQRECAHPTAHVRATIDPRYEMCHLCRLIRVAPIPAPWIIAYDEEQPPAPAPALFLGYDPTRDPASPAFVDPEDEQGGGYDPEDEDEQYLELARFGSLD